MSGMILFRQLLLKIIFLFLNNNYKSDPMCFQKYFFHYFKLVFIVLNICFIFRPVAAENSVVEIELKSAWQMKCTTDTKWINAVVPGCVHSDLLRNKLIPDPYYRTNEKDLQWIDKKDWEYRTTFDVSDKVFKNDHVELVFKGLDTFAEVYMNNKKVLSTDNMFREWVVDVKKGIHKGNNNLRIVFLSPINQGLKLLKEYGYVLQASNDQSIIGGLLKDEVVSPFVRKAPYHFGWDWGPRFVTSGIWQPAFVRAWNNYKITDLYIQQQSLTDQLAVLNAQIEIQSTKNQKVELEISTETILPVRQIAKLKKGLNMINIPFEIKNPKRWWTNGLGKQNLYKVNVKISANQTVDIKTTEIGLRTLKLIQKPDSAGHSFYFELNGVPVFAKGENHIPNDMFADRLTHQVYDWEIETATKSNLNMLRVWGGGIYEDDYFYQLCDRNGILIWQDFMFAGALYPGNKAFLNSIIMEACYQVKRLRNHPSIALWCGNNEIDTGWQNYDPKGGWGWKELYNEDQKRQIWSAYDTTFNHIFPDIVKSNLGQTPYWQSSPSSILPEKYANDTNKNGDVHYWGVWWGKQPFEKFTTNIGRFMSEYGFQSFPELETVKKYSLPEDYDIESEVMRSHQRSSIGNKTIINYMDMYYRKPANFEKFLYVGQVLQAYGIKFAMESHRRAMPYNMGSLVWQINDCWPVASGSSSDYFHRWKALQYEIKRSFEPIIISVYADGDKTTVKVISDKLKDFPGQILFKVSDFNGRILQTKTLPVLVKANAVTSVLSEETTKLTDNVNGNFITVSLKNKNGFLVENNYFFTQPKNMNLTKPNILSTVEENGSYWVITLKSDVLAKNLYLNFTGTEGLFSDNYFDLLPGIERKITFTPNDKLVSPKKPEMISLVDSY
jgi:beta-mannosidase